jgi:hypothetical protein
MVMMMISILYYITTRDRRDRDRIRMVVGFTTTYAMSLALYELIKHGDIVCLMALNTTFNNISII